MAANITAMDILCNAGKMLRRNGIGIPFLDETVQALYCGRIMTAHNSGNYTYGYLDHAYGIPLEILYGGSYYAADMPKTSESLGEELDDWYYISLGYYSYSAYPVLP